MFQPSFHPRSFGAALWLRGLALGFCGLACVYAAAQSAAPLKSCPAPQRMQALSQAPITLRFVGDLVLGNSHVVENIPADWDAMYFG